MYFFSALLSFFSFAYDADQICRPNAKERRRTITDTAKPTITATASPTINHIDRSVGLPVNVRETLELNEWDSLKPKISSTIPSARIASPIMLFIVCPFLYRLFSLGLHGERIGTFPMLVSGGRAGEPEFVAAEVTRRISVRGKRLPHPCTGSCECYPFSGSLMVNVVPSPGRLSAWIVPLCSSMMRRVTVRPRLVPFCLVVKNGSNNRAMFSCVIPPPLSETRMRIQRFGSWPSSPGSNSVETASVPLT